MMIKQENQNIVKELDDIFNPVNYYSHGMFINIKIKEKTFNLEILKGPLFNSKMIKSRSYLHASYIILNSLTGVFYIGSTSDIYTRLCEHRCGLNSNNHEVPKLQQSLKDSGKQYLDLCIFLTKDRDQAYDVEQYLLDLYFHNERCLNKNPTSRSCKGVARSEETREKISSYTRTPEIKENMRQSAINRIRTNKRPFRTKGISINGVRDSNNRWIYSDHYKQKMSDRLKGISHSKEWNEKVSKSKKCDANIAHCLANSLKLAKPVVVSGKRYNSVSEAARQLNMSQAAIIYRLKNNREKYKDDYYC